MSTEADKKADESLSFEESYSYRDSDGSLKEDTFSDSNPKPKLTPEYIASVAKTIFPESIPSEQEEIDQKLEAYFNSDRERKGMLSKAALSKTQPVFTKPRPEINEDPTANESEAYHVALDAYNKEALLFDYLLRQWRTFHPSADSTMALHLNTSVASNILGRNHKKGKGVSERVASGTRSGGRRTKRSSRKNKRSASKRVKRKRSNRRHSSRK